MRAVLLVLILLLAAFLAGGLILPSTVTVERSLEVQRPPATVFTLFNGFGDFREWLPWAEFDPEASWVLSGPGQGVGARLEWSGDPALLGSGSYEITASQAYERIELRVEVEGQARAKQTITISGDGLGSRVTWYYTADVTQGQGWLEGLFAGYIAMLVGKWMATDFEQGLRRFKAYAETLPAADFSDAGIERVDVAGEIVLLTEGTVSGARGADGVALAAAFSRVSAVIRDLGATVSGPPVAVSRGGGDGSYRFEAAIPVQESSVSAGDPRLPDTVRVARSPAGNAVRIVHRGPYDTIAASYARLDAWVAARGLDRAGVSWERYVDDPSRTPTDELRTEIYVLLSAD